MALTPEQAVERARLLYEQREAERPALDEVRRYWKARQRFPAVIPPAVPAEVRVLARVSRVNVIDIVIESLAQSLAVEGFRAEREAKNADVWRIWQGNGLDAGQSEIHRAALAYGVSYAVVTPGQPVPVIRGLSPRAMTTLFDPDKPDWPVYALERRAPKSWRLYDAERVYELAGEGGTFALMSDAAHDAGVTPVVRYLEVRDPDWEDEPTDESFASTGMLARQVIGQVAPLMAAQDQINLSLFGLKVAEHYGAHRQRYVIGWLAPDEKTRMQMGASTLWTFEDGPDQLKIGDLESTPLDGYLKSLQSSFRQVAALTQTPAHELIGDLVNLSAEALAAAEAGRDRRVADRQTTIGESHEQTLALAGRLAGIEVPDNAQVVWRDTSARSLAATVDALGKVAQMLKVPPEELWERIPGTSQQDVERYRARAKTRAEAGAIA